MKHCLSQTEATFEAAVDAKINAAVSKLHTALPARVVSFDPQKQTVTLEALVQQVAMDGKIISIPPLMEVPVQYPRGGGFVCTFPLTKGDEGIALFSERCIDAWWQNGEPAPPIGYRKHDLSDAMFIPGISSVPKAQKDFFMDGLSLQTGDGSTYFRVTKGTIYIKGNIEHEGNSHQKGNVVQEGNREQTGNSKLTGDYEQKGATHQQGDFDLIGTSRATAVNGLALIGNGLSVGGAVPPVPAGAAPGSAGSSSLRMSSSGSTLTMNGSIEVTGSVTAGSDVKAGSVSLSNHVHGNGNNGANTTKPI